MNLICITESELSQWVSRRYLDTLTARVLTDCETASADIFCTSPYLKRDDARGRVIVNLKDNWMSLSIRLNTSQTVSAISIPIDAVLEIAPTMDQYAKRLASYQLPIALWSIEKIWDRWLIDQAVSETYRAIIFVTKKINFIDWKIIYEENFLKSLIEKTLRPSSITGNEGLLKGWENVLARRDSWIQTLRTNGYLGNTKMLTESSKIISNDLANRPINFDFLLPDEERSWNIQDLTPEILQNFKNWQSATLINPPLFCIVAFLKLYDEIHNGDKSWHEIFQILKYCAEDTISQPHADILTAVLLASLKPEEIYSIEFSSY